MNARALLLLSLSCGILSASAQFLEKAEFEGGFERAATDGPRTVWVNPTFCRFVLDLSVDRSGRLLSAAVNVPLSSCKDSALVNKANALAQRYVFTPNALAPEPQAVRFVWAVGERPKYEDLFANEPGPDMLPPPDPATESERIWTVVEVPPQFPGGHEVMRTYLERMVKYPTDAEPPLREGMVLVGFVVNAEGLVEDVNVIKGLGYPYDSEARRVAKAMPKWIPGMQNGHAVRTRCEMPVVFKRPSGTGTTGEGSGGGSGQTEFPSAPITYELQDRLVVWSPKIAQNQQEGGRVVMDIWVDRTGKVLRTTVGRGSTTNAKSLVDVATTATMTTHFNIDQKAPEQQRGKLTYVFYVD